MSTPIHHSVNGPALETLDWSMRIGQLTNAYGMISEVYGEQDAEVGHVTGRELYQYRALFCALRSTHRRGLSA
jgi:hypothetical protein